MASSVVFLNAKPHPVAPKIGLTKEYQFFFIVSIHVKNLKIKYQNEKLQCKIQIYILICHFAF